MELKLQAEANESMYYMLKESGISARIDEEIGIEFIWRKATTISGLESFKMSALSSELNGTIDDEPSEPSESLLSPSPMKDSPKRAKQEARLSSDVTMPFEPIARSLSRDSYRTERNSPTA